MNINEFDYNLPQELIAQTPLLKRDESKLLVVNRNNHSLTDKKFYDIYNYLNKGDILVLNNTRVIPARLFGKTLHGGKVETLLVQPLIPADDGKALHLRWNG